MSLEVMPRVYLRDNYHNLRCWHTHLSARQIVERLLPLCFGYSGRILVRIPCGEKWLPQKVGWSASIGFRAHLDPIKHCRSRQSWDA